MINKSLFKLSIVGQIDWLARFIIVHSIIYYEYDSNVISDKTYDEYAYYLAKLIKENPEEFKKCHYRDIVYDFDGTTGFDLRSRLSKQENEYLSNLAYHVLHDSQQNNIKEQGRK